MARSCQKTEKLKQSLIVGSLAISNQTWFHNCGLGHLAQSLKVQVLAETCPWVLALFVFSPHWRCSAVLGWVWVRGFQTYGIPKHTTSAQKCKWRKQGWRHKPGWKVRHGWWTTKTVYREGWRGLDIALHAADPVQSLAPCLVPGALSGVILEQEPEVNLQQQLDWPKNHLKNHSSF